MSDNVRSRLFSSLTDFNEKLRRIIVICTVCIEYHIHYQYLKRYTEPNCDSTLTDTEVSTYPGHTVIKSKTDYSISLEYDILPH